jgi:hypothetical protein
MTGYAALDGNGTWTNDPAYGPVWIPTAVATDWAPYHDGHWAWIEPWGWTWVDDAPWGFAPFHYGRWAWLRGRSHWGWVPGQVAVARPVYAPALVAFVAGGSGGTRWGVSLSNGAPGVAWLPLAPGEAYRPGYRVSPRYVTRVNQTIVVRNTTINNTNVYVNQQAPHAVAAVPSSAFVQGQHVRGTEGSVPANVLRHAHFVQTAALTPAAQSRLGQARLAPAHPGLVRQAVVQAHVPAVPQATPRPHPDVRKPDPRQAIARPELNRPDVNRAAKGFQPERLPPPAAGPEVQSPVHRHEVPHPPSASTAQPRPQAVPPVQPPRPVPRPPSPVQAQQERQVAPPHPPQPRQEEAVRQQAKPPQQRHEPPAPPPHQAPPPPPLPQQHPAQAAPQSEPPHPAHARPEHRPRKQDEQGH